MSLLSHGLQPVVNWRKRTELNPFALPTTKRAGISWDQPHQRIRHKNRLVYSFRRNFILYAKSRNLSSLLAERKSHCCGGDSGSSLDGIDWSLRVVVQNVAKIQAD